MGWRGGSGSDERSYRRDCDIAAAAQEPQSTSGSGRKRRMQRQSAPLDESWSGVNMWKSDGSQSRGGGACAGGRMRGRAGAPADECGQVASMRALLAKARTGGPLPGGRADGRAGDAMQMLRQACEKARQRMSARAGRLRGCARCWPKRGRAGGRADRCQAGGRAGGRMGRWATPCDSCGMHARKRARRCTAYSAESPGPPPAPAGG